MKLKSFHWTRRTVVYALIGLAVLLALAVIWRSNGGVLSAHYNVTTTDGRIAYLQALGWEADPATETAQEIVIPRVFSGVFSDYNALQKQQGFDLSTYAGETCTAYTLPRDELRGLDGHCARAAVRLPQPRHRRRHPRDGDGRLHARSAMNGRKNSRHECAGSFGFVRVQADALGLRRAPSSAQCRSAP